NHNPAGFAPELDNMRKALPTGMVGSDARKALSGELQSAVFDMATLWDRAYGGTTMVLHIDGTTVPNTPALPEYLRASVHLPPRLVARHPASHGPIAQIVQMFIESVGVPTVQQWRADANSRGWPLTQGGDGSSANPISPILVPTPASNSSHYKFFGRAAGVLDLLLAGSIPSAPPAPAPGSPAIPVVEIPDDDDDYAIDCDVLDAFERAGYAEVQLHALQEQVNILTTQLASLEVDNADLRGQLASRTAGEIFFSLPYRCIYSMFLAPTTPSRSQLRSPLSPKTPVRSPVHRALASTSPAHSPSQLRSFGATISAQPRLGSPSHVGTSSQGNTGQFTHTGPFRLDSYLRERGLEHHGSAIQLILRTFHAVEWVQQFCALGMSQDVAVDLANSLAASESL
ncbi:hypothetical protein R3P38DRAFT_2579420, partial [Favolaschia claudopus]